MLVCRWVGGWVGGCVCVLVYLINGRKYFVLMCLSLCIIKYMHILGQLLNSFEFKSYWSNPNGYYLN